MSVRGRRKQEAAEEHGGSSKGGRLFAGMMRKTRPMFRRGGGRNRAAESESNQEVGPQESRTSTLSLSREGPIASGSSNLGEGYSRERSGQSVAPAASGAQNAFTTGSETVQNDQMPGLYWVRHADGTRPEDAVRPLEPSDVAYHHPVVGRRYSRMSHLRGGMFRRRRWLLSEYDWNVQEFDRSYLFTSMPQHVRILEYFDDLTYEEMLALEEHMGKVTKGLNDDELAKIPVETVRDVCENIATEERMCSICLEDFVEGEVARKLNCSHMFHVGCVDAWLRNNKSCPVCKMEVVGSDGNPDNETAGEDKGSSTGDKLEASSTMENHQTSSWSRSFDSDTVNEHSTMGARASG